MEKLPDWANCWLVDRQGNKIPADKYEMSMETFYYDQHGNIIKLRGMIEETSKDGLWSVVVLILLFISVCIWSALS